MANEHQKLSHTDLTTQGFDNDNSLPVSVFSAFPGDFENNPTTKLGDTWKREEIRERLEKERKMLTGKSTQEKAKILKALQL